MSKEQCPVILPPDEKGNTEINPVYVAYMRQITIGTRPDQIGLSDKEVRVLRSNMRDAGIDFPFVTKDWFATPAQRKILHLVELGNDSYEQIAKGADIDYGTARTHVSGLKRSLSEAGINMEIKIRRKKLNP